MIKPNVAQSISAVACAIIVATLMAPITPTAAVATPQTTTKLPGAKGDRAPLVAVAPPDCCTAAQEGAQNNRQQEYMYPLRAAPHLTPRFLDAETVRR